MVLMQSRLFILSDSPPEKDVQWSEQGCKHLINFTKIMELKRVDFRENKN